MSLKRSGCARTCSVRRLSPIQSSGPVSPRPSAHPPAGGSHGTGGSVCGGGGSGVDLDHPGDGEHALVEGALDPYRRAECLPARRGVDQPSILDAGGRHRDVITRRRRGRQVHGGDHGRAEPDRPGPVAEQGAHALDRDPGAVVGGQRDRACRSATGPPGAGPSVSSPAVRVERERYDDRGHGDRHSRDRSQRHPPSVESACPHSIPGPVTTSPAD